MYSRLTLPFLYNICLKWLKWSGIYFYLGYNPLFLFWFHMCLTPLTKYILKLLRTIEKNVIIKTASLFEFLHHIISSWNKKGIKCICLFSLKLFIFCRTKKSLNFGCINFMTNSSCQLSMELKIFLCSISVLKLNFPLKHNFKCLTCINF